MATRDLPANEWVLLLQGDSLSIGCKAVIIEGEEAPYYAKYTLTPKHGSNKIPYHAGSLEFTIDQSTVDAAQDQNDEKAKYINRLADAHDRLAKSVNHAKMALSSMQGVAGVEMTIVGEICTCNITFFEKKEVVV